MVVAIIALIVGATGSAYAVSKINGSQIARGSIGGAKLKPGAVGAQQLAPGALAVRLGSGRSDSIAEIPVGNRLTELVRLEGMQAGHYLITGTAIVTVHPDSGQPYPSTISVSCELQRDGLRFESTGVSDGEGTYVLPIQAEADLREGAVLSAACGKSTRYDRTAGASFTVNAIRLGGPLLEDD